MLSNAVKVSLPDVLVKSCCKTRALYCSRVSKVEIPSFCRVSVNFCETGAILSASVKKFSRKKFILLSYSSKPPKAFTKSSAITVFKVPVIFSTFFPNSSIL